MNAFERLKYRLLIGLTRKLRRKAPEVHRLFNAAGIYFLPTGYYNCVPTVDEIEQSFEYRDGGKPYLESGIFDGPRLRAYLEGLLPFAAEFSPPVAGDPERPAGYFWNNGMFFGADARAYHAIIRSARPRHILEVGGGFSTLIASAALGLNGTGEITCIEPYPRPFLSGLSRVQEVITKPVQEVPVAYFQERLGDGDLLFIDSTHTVKTGSDCLYLYLQVLPKLERRILIHAHDIYLPSAQPKEWQLKRHWFWTEQYLLLAFLLGNPHYQVCFGSHYHRLENPGLLESFAGGKERMEGGSFWFQRV